MASAVHPDYPPNLTPDQTDYLLSELKDWSLSNGLAVRPSQNFISENLDPGGVLAVPAPVTLFPSPFPRACLDEAREIQQTYNELYAAISRDEEWLGEIVQELVEVDDFIAKLWDVHLAVKKEGYVQDLSLGIFRSDYMLHIDPEDPTSKAQIKQVEFNTIASSFGGLSNQVSLLHKYLLDASAYPPHPILTASSLPSNPAIEALTASLTQSHQAYGPSKAHPALPLCILIIVQENEHNIFDQRLLTQHLQTAHRIPTFRLPFSCTLASTSIPPSSPSRPLIYHHPSQTQYEVSTLYFRAGYTPSDYELATSFPSRQHLERSAAIKCPSILTHLAGCKKIQQVLATPNSPHLSRFLTSPQSAALKRTFTTLHPLDNTPSGHTALRLATSPTLSKSYVLKPQREGGGNNIYKTAIPAFLASLPDPNSQRAYILMQLIEPPPLRNLMVREGLVKSGVVVCELGVYGTVLWRHGDGEMLRNEEAGWLLRTKGRESEEGGVAAGFGAVDSVCLV